MRQSWKLYLGILLVSLATLALEILQVRLFSFMLWHHLAYMVVTVTLLGFGAAGATVAVKGVGDEENTMHRAGWSALWMAITTILGFAVVSRIPLDTYMESSGLQLSFIFLYYAFLIFPYYFAGLTITLLLTRFSNIVHRLYFWNLIGSALGCAVFLLLLISLGGDRAVFAVASIAALSAAFLFSSKKMQISSIVLAVVMLMLIPATTSILPIRPAPSKALGLFMANTHDLNIESSEWDPIARIDVAQADSFAKMLRYHEAEVQKIFTIDGDAYTFVYRYDKPLAEMDLLSKTLYGSAYFFKENPKVAVIGLGGGTDIATALHFKSREITGIEINQAMIDAAMTTFDTYPINPYRDPTVNIVHEEGRSFLRRADEKYDIIQMSGVDTWSALSTGAYVLSENYLYTKEAFSEYYDHLGKDGILCMIRWIFEPPRECLRLATIQSEVLRERGIKMPWLHMVVLQQGLLASVVTKMTPFTRREIAGLKRQLSNKPELSILYAPGIDGNSAFHRYFKSLKQDREQSFIDQYPFKLGAVDDDRPFFFEFYKWGDMFGKQFGYGGYLVAARPIGYIILLASLVQALLLGLVFILYPLWRFKRDELIEGGGSWRMIVYFACLGLGFMFIEVALMQKFVLFLGHPTYSIAVTLFSILIFTGIGSSIAGRIKLDQRKLILYATLSVAAMAVLYTFLLSPLFTSMLGLPLWLRIVVSVVLLAPLGIVMGMPFPTGLSYVRLGARNFVPWAFGINGVASVVASILCIILALMNGFTFVLITATAIYLIAGFTMFGLKLTDRDQA